MSANEKIEVRILDADGLANNTDPAILVNVITRREIESVHLASILERLHVLTDSAENVRRYRAAVMFQVDGYDSDPRELPEIPEVRAYFQALVRVWPHFLWFAHQGVGAIGLLLALLCRVRIVRSADAGYATEFQDTEEVKATLLDLLNRGMVLFSTYGIASQEVDVTIGSALEELGLGEQR